MHFHDTCTRNSDYLIVFIKTGDAYKIRMLSHTIFNTFKKCDRGEDGNIVKNDGFGKMVVVFTIIEINYLGVSLFFDLVRVILYLYRVSHKKVYF